MPLDENPVPREEYDRNRGKIYNRESIPPSQLLRRLEAAYVKSQAQQRNSSKSAPSTVLDEDANESPKQETLAMANEVCPKCGALQMSYRAVQLRSADEGQTIFYKCVDCGYEMTVNT